MRNYEQELRDRVAFIRQLLAESHAKGIVFGNSGGKDSALVGILCKKACDDTVGIIMPCASQRNYTSDKADGMEVAEQFHIETRTVDLTAQREAALVALEGVTEMTPAAIANLAPRLRMMTLYAIAGAENRLVAGTGNRSERYMGYFTKWGDGACDFNPISDLTVTEVYEFLAWLDAPESIRQKAPSAGLFEGQTDESEMGVTYAAIDEYITQGTGSAADIERIESYHRRNLHKLSLPRTFADD